MSFRKHKARYSQEANILAISGSPIHEFSKYCKFNITPNLQTSIVAGDRMSPNHKTPPLPTTTNRSVISPCRQLVGRLPAAKLVDFVRFRVKTLSIFASFRPVGPKSSTCFNTTAALRRQTHDSASGKQIWA